MLHVQGEVRSPRAFRFAELASLPEQIADIGTLIPGRQGGGVWLRAVLDAIELNERATYLTLHATDGQYSASVPLEAVRDYAVVLYRLGDEPLPAGQGGPLRFLITNVDACGIGEVDTCANVKFLSVIELTDGPGADTRRIPPR
jgi:DMSO/TMAO reductase YedYZ molybdopterin-dependent catalytic subunit